MRRSCLAAFALPFLAFAILGVVESGCKKESGPAAATAPATQAAAAAIPTPPPYRMPDTLPAHATVTLVKQEGGAGVYKAAFDTPFQFDAARAQLALEINTVGWAYHGRIVITNKNDDDNAGAETHEQFYDDPPTDEKLNLPEERQALHPDENQWIKDGGITLTIRNAEGTDAAATVPKILTVDLVAQPRQE